MTASEVRAVVLPAGFAAQYQQDGYAVLRGVFAPAEMAALAAEAEQLAARSELIHVDNLRCRWKNNAAGECLFECFDPVIDIGRECRRIAHDSRILGVLSTLYGDGACLFKDKLIFKPAGAEGYALHQDFISWPDFPETFTTVIVPIDPVHAANGATEVFPGYHRSGYLSPRDGMYHDLPLTAIDESRGVLLELAPGDVAIFGCYAPHRSAPNRTDAPRRQLYLSYNARGDGGERRGRHYHDFQQWLRERYAEYGRTEVYFR